MIARLVKTLMERAGNEIVTRMLMQQAATSEHWLLPVGAVQDQRWGGKGGCKGDCRVQQGPLHLSVIHGFCTP